MELEVRSGQLHHNSTHGHLSLLTGPGLTLSGAEDIPDKQAPVGPHYPRHRLARGTEASFGHRYTGILCSFSLRVRVLASFA